MTTAEIARRRTRPRRTHAERTAETTRRIKEAAIETIAELGFKRATATEIARRAGVSWGAAQHHFGDKTGILLAVLDDGAKAFLDRIDRVDAGASLKNRVEGFVDAAWEHFGSDAYRSSSEILTNLAAAPGEEGELPEGTAIVQLDRWVASWRRLFGDVPLTSSDAMVIQGYAVAVLSGLSSVHVLQRNSAGARNRQLALLKDTLLRELTAAKRDAAR